MYKLQYTNEKNSNTLIHKIICEFLGMKIMISIFNLLIQSFNTFSPIIQQFCSEILKMFMLMRQGELLSF